MTVLCMLYTIRCNPVRPLNAATWTVCTSAGFSRCSGRTLVHLCPPRCRTSLYRRTFTPLSDTLWTILLTPYSMVWDWLVSREGPMLSYWPKLLYPYNSLLLFSNFLFSVYMLALWGWGLRTDRVYTTLFRPCTDDLFLF